MSTFIIRFLQDNLIKHNYMNIYDLYNAEILFDFTKSETLRGYNLLLEDSEISNDYNTNSSNKMGGGQFYITMEKCKSDNNLYYNSLKRFDYFFFLCNNLLCCHYKYMYKYLFPFWILRI